MPLFYVDTWYIVLVFPAILLALWAQMRVQSAYNKYSKIAASKNITGADVARYILDQNNFSQITIEHIKGNLTDHYDPRTNVVRLSDGVYGSNSIAALGIAAHEVGHAIQHANSYTPIKIRNAILPVAQIGSYAAFPLAILGLIFSNMLLNIGIVLFAAVVLFQFITLPVEFDASKRAIACLSENSYLDSEELEGTKKVLGAAALTYVAAAFTALMNLLRLILIAGRRRD